MSLLTNQVVVLNSAWLPISYTNVKDALTMMYKGKAKAICHKTYNIYSFDDWADLEALELYIRTPNLRVRLPKTILLLGYSKVPPVTRPFTRRGVYERDQYRCQYCGCRPITAKRSIDHIIPQSRGGMNAWDNCVTCCKRCNERKADRTPAEANMKLLNKPYAPTSRMIDIKGLWDERDS